MANIENIQKYNTCDDTLTKQPTHVHKINISTLGEHTKDSLKNIIKQYKLDRSTKNLFNYSFCSGALCCMLSAYNPLCFAIGTLAMTSGTCAAYYENTSLKRLISDSSIKLIKEALKVDSQKNNTDDFIKDFATLENSEAESIFIDKLLSLNPEDIIRNLDLGHDL